MAITIDDWEGLMLGRRLGLAAMVIAAAILTVPALPQAAACCFYDMLVFESG